MKSVVQTMLKGLKLLFHLRFICE